MRLWMLPALSLSAISVAMLAACDEDPVDSLVPTGGQIVGGADTTIFRGDSLRFGAVLLVGDGFATPDTVAWSLSDSTVLAICHDCPDSTVVSGKSRGSAYVIAEIDGLFTDSVEVSVVEPGDVRWRQPTGPYITIPTPALDAAGNLYVVYDAGTTGELVVFAPEGSVLLQVPTCRADMAPSVTPDGLAHLTTFECTQRHGPGGGVDWTLPLGTFHGGVAVDGDGSVYVAWDQRADMVTQQASVLVSKISSTGTELWRDTLRLVPVDDSNYQKMAPAIGANGEVYVMWGQWDTGEYWLTRIAPDGPGRWTVPIADRTRRSSPALFGDRVAVTYTGGSNSGLAVYDTTGQLLWEAQTGPTFCSSPVVDGQGNIYVQSNSRLFSYDASGSLRWSADTLAHTNGFGVGAPVLLADGSLLAPCDGPFVDGHSTDELCAVDGSDGSLIWRSATGSAMLGTPAVAPDGQIFIVADKPGTFTEGETISLWGRVPPLDEGWPTEGRDMGRTRRQR